MLFLKSWLETRWWFLFYVGFFSVVLSSGYVQFAHGRPANPLPAVQRLAGTLNVFTLFWIMPAVMLGGAGIKTSAPFKSGRGIHESMLFTLSLPVSRLRLLSTRASLGLIEMAGIVLVGCIGLSFLLPVQFPELSFSTGDLFRYAFTVLTCTTGFFFMSVFSATFLDDMWQYWGSLIGIALLRGLSSLIGVPADFDIFHSIGGGSPLVTHALPWTAIGISVGIGSVLFLGAVKIVDAREY